MSESKKKELYSHPAVRPVSLEDLTTLSNDLGLRCTDDELKEFKEYMNEAFANTYQCLSELVCPTNLVKYPRTPGHRPVPEENIHNAWFWKCDIKGAPDGILKDKKIAIKDNCCVAGVPMRNGTSLLDGYTPDMDATVVTRILDAGGNIVGKANCDCMCYGGSSWTNITGPVLNPHDTTRSAGGSSGGSAALVQTGEVDLAIGGDQAGSIRIPSSWCGTVGIKPTWGLVPCTGSVTLETTLDHLGPIARTVTDCALLLEVIAGYDDGDDPRQPRDLKDHQYSKLLTTDLEGKKIGLLKEGFETCEDDVVNVVRTAVSKLSDAGAVVDEVSIPMHANGLRIWVPIGIEGGYKCMVQGNGTGYNWKGRYVESMQEALFRGYRCRLADMSDVMKYLFLYGEYISRNYGNTFYGKGQNLSTLLKEAYDKMLDKYDVIVMPTLPYKAPKLPEKTASLTDRMNNALTMVRNTAPFDVTGHPSLSINAGFSDGLPVGMMITGKHFDETTILQVAYAFEKLRDGK